MKHAISHLFVIGLVIVVTGCASIQNVPSRVKSFVTRSPDSDDPLVAESGDVSTSYRKAKRELKNADLTMLKFARWSEEKGDHAEAKERYQDVLADNPENVEARLGIARVEFATGRKAEAEEILKLTAHRHPDEAEVWIERGRVQSAQEQWGAAVQSLTKAVQLQPSSQEAQYELGLALARSDRLDEAQSHLAQAVGESPALYNIGYVLYEADRPEEAAHWFDRALKSHPDERTRTMARRMLKDIKRPGGYGPTSNQVATATSPRSSVNMQLTSFQSYRETPNSPSSAQNELTSPQQMPSANAAASASSSAPAQTNRFFPNTHQSPRFSNPQLSAANSGQVQFSARPAASKAAASASGHAMPLWNGPAGQAANPATPQVVRPAPESVIQPPAWKQ